MPISAVVSPRGSSQCWWKHSSHSWSVRSDLWRLLFNTKDKLEPSTSWSTSVVCGRLSLFKRLLHLDLQILVTPHILLTELTGKVVLEGFVWFPSVAEVRRLSIQWVSAGGNWSRRSELVSARWLVAPPTQNHGLSEVSSLGRWLLTLFQSLVKQTRCVVC